MSVKLPLGRANSLIQKWAVESDHVGLTRAVCPIDAAEEASAVLSAPHALLAQCQHGRLFRRASVDELLRFNHSRAQIDDAIF